MKEKIWIFFNVMQTSVLTGVIQAPYCWIFLSLIFAFSQERFESAFDSFFGYGCSGMLHKLGIAKHWCKRVSKAMSFLTHNWKLLVHSYKGRWVAKLVARLLRQLSGFESRQLSKIQNGRHQQRSDQYTLARQKYKKIHTRVRKQQIFTLIHKRKGGTGRLQIEKKTL